MITTAFAALDLGAMPAEDFAAAKDWKVVVERCTATRYAPLAPDAFNEKLARKRFTSGRDRIVLSTSSVPFPHEGVRAPFVERKYNNFSVFKT